MAGVGYAGVGVMPVVVLGADGTGQDTDIIEGVVYAADHGADVILMAFSNPGYSPALQAAIDYAWAQGAVLVAATGNDGSSSATYPAGDRGVIGVAATDQADVLAGFSNYGAAAFMAAPGVDIQASEPGGTRATISGTSAAAAHVAGGAALLAALDPAASNGAIVGRLARNADPLSSGEAGNGRLNLARAASDTSTDEVQPAGAAPLGRRSIGWALRHCRSTSSATVNGAATTTVAGGATITAVVNVTTDNGGGNQNWRSTGWRIAGTAPGTVTCFNNANHDASGTFTETFPITAPAFVATYNAYFIAYSDDACSNQASATFTLTNGVVVNSNAAPTLTAMSPNAGNRLQTLNVVLTGTKLRKCVFGQLRVGHPRSTRRRSTARLKSQRISRSPAPLRQAPKDRDREQLRAREVAPRAGRTFHHQQPFANVDCPGSLYL